MGALRKYLRVTLVSETLKSAGLTECSGEGDREEEEEGRRETERDSLPRSAQSPLLECRWSAVQRPF